MSILAKSSQKGEGNGPFEKIAEICVRLHNAVNFSSAVCEVAISILKYGTKKSRLFTFLNKKDRLSIPTYYFTFLTFM